MVIATLVVFTITELAPHIGPNIAGLISPFPILGALLAIFTHHQGGQNEAIVSLKGLTTGLASPALFFLSLALLLPHVGSTAFVLSSLVGILAQALTGKIIFKIIN